MRLNVCPLTLPRCRNRERRPWSRANKAVGAERAGEETSSLMGDKLTIRSSRLLFARRCSQGQIGRGWEQKMMGDGTIARGKDIWQIGRLVAILRVTWSAPPTPSTQRSVVQKHEEITRCRQR